MTKPRLIVIGPIPPPVHGVAVSTSLVLANRELHERFAVEHVDTSDHRSRGNINTWDAANVLGALRGAARLVRRLRGRRGIVYLPLSQGLPGFLRDSLFIHLAATAGWKVTAHLRGSEFDRLYADRGPLFRAWVRVSLRRLDAIAVMGSRLRSIFRGLVPPDRIAVVPNGTPDPCADGQQRDAKTVLFLSNLRRRKGVREAVEVARLVLEAEPEIQFLFAGEWESEAVEREVRLLAAGDNRIRFVGEAHGDRKRDLLLQSSILLFPPVEPEGHPRVVIEALAAALPVVATDRGAIAETVLDGECGFVVSDADPPELAAHVLRLVRDPALRERMSAAARARYLAAFTQEEADARLAGWLSQLIPRGGTRGGEA